MLYIDSFIPIGAISVIFGVVWFFVRVRSFNARDQINQDGFDFVLIGCAIIGLVLIVLGLFLKPPI